MKRFLSVILCMIFVLSLTACGDKTGGGSDHSVDIEYYAKLGQISDIEYKLGDSVEDTKTILSETLDDHGEPMYFDYQSGDYTVMTDGSVCCCYKTADEAAGITHIVKYGDAYGFTVGAVSTQVRDTMSDMGYDTEEREAKSGELFFLPASAGITVLEYQIKDNTVLFVFQEHALSTTVIY
ncbi:MAG: hypothetical protein IJZ21_04795 [Clostridia bacterium]|nr:hypothetical protein [Clostridia bacterium]